MYGFPQDGILENKLLQKRIATYGSRTTPHIPGLWRNETISIQFSLVVDDFGVEYEQNEDTLYLLDVLNAHCEVVEVDWEGNILCAINLEWDYNRQTVDISIPGYVEKVIHKYQHTTPIRTQHHPHWHNPP